MSRTLRWGLGAVAAMFVMATAARADDVSSLKAELADLKAKVAAMESSEMAPAAGGDAESLTSMKKKGAIKIGGHVNVGLLVVDRDEDPTQVNGEDDEIQSTEFRGEAELKFDVAASKDMGLKMKLDLEDLWDQTVQQDDLLEELYFYWKNVGGSSWTLNFGKKEVDAFGMDKTVAAGGSDDPFIDSFTHGEATLFDADEEQDLDALNVDNDNQTNVTRYLDTDGDGQIDTVVAAEGDPLNAHNDVGDVAWLGEVDNVFGLEAIYAYKDLAKFYIHVFQDNTTTGNGRNTRGMHEDRSDDTFFFQSWALGVQVMPIEGLHLEASFINVHNDSMGDTRTATAGRYAEDDTQALSIGVDYKFKSVPVELFSEYVHQWDEDFDDREDRDVFQLGLVWGVTENIDLGVMGEYMNHDIDTNTQVYDDEDYWNLDMCVTYKFEGGITASLEYVHQWWDGDQTAAGAGDLDADADAIGFIMSWTF